MNNEYKYCGYYLYTSDTFSLHARKIIPQILTINSV